MPEVTQTTTPRPQKKSNDFTGRQAAAEKAKAATTKRITDEQTALQREQEKEEFTNAVYDENGMVIDPAELPAEPLPQVADDGFTVVDELVVDTGSIALADGTRIIRVSEDIENMTYGDINKPWHFKAGGRYKVPLGLAQRLEKLGLVWH